MNLLKINSTIVSEVIEISKLAGKAIMDIYSTDFDYQANKQQTNRQQTSEQAAERQASSNR